MPRREEVWRHGADSGVSLRMLQNWRERGDAPKPMANGFYDVAAWREFMQRHDLQGEPGATDAGQGVRSQRAKCLNSSRSNGPLRNVPLKPRPPLPRRFDSTVIHGQL